VSAVTAELLENPTRGQFWNNYRHELELLDLPVMDLDARRRDLMSYYKIDPVTSKPELDPLTGAKIPEGTGTMQGVINDVIERAGEQYNLLTATRQQLRVVRTELVETIKDLNQQKQTLRDRLVHIVSLNNEITKLNNDLTIVRRDLALANERIQEQQLQLTDLEQEKHLLTEERNTLKRKVEEVNAEMKVLKEKYSGAAMAQAGGGSMDGRLFLGGGIEAGSIAIAVGVKGRVISVDQKNLFVVMELDEAFTAELLGASVEGRFPMVDLLVQRGEDKPTFITKVRLTQLKQEKNLAIGDILTDWQQGPIEIGDIIFYQ